ncbi:MAG: carbamoyl phosphate synthase large subunit, partial [Chloroflexi bacterium]
SLDYVVVKIPRWDLGKFKGVDETIGTGMKSVGEVMGIGRTFEEAYQKAIRMLDLDFEGVTSDKVFAGSKTADDSISKYLYTPTPKRVFALSLAMSNNISIEKIAAITGIDPWFLQRIKHIVDIEQTLLTSKNLSAPRLLALKQAGISDKRIGELTGKSGLDIRALRKKLGITPSVFQIDTLAAEFPSDTNYLYMTYNGQHHDVMPLGNEGVIVLGSGPYRIGSSVEFDWTSVSTVQALKKYHKRSVVINCNPETVSTDYDIS